MADGSARVRIPSRAPVGQKIALEIPRDSLSCVVVAFSAMPSLVPIGRSGDTDFCMLQLKTHLSMSCERLLLVHRQLWDHNSSASLHQANPS